MRWGVARRCAIFEVLRLSRFFELYPAYHHGRLLKTGMFLLRN
jgi:hypothetical protein